MLTNNKKKLWGRNKRVVTSPIYGEFQFWSYNDMLLDVDNIFGMAGTVRLTSSYSQFCTFALI